MMLRSMLRQQGRTALKQQRQRLVVVVPRMNAPLARSCLSTTTAQQPTIIESSSNNTLTTPLMITDLDVTLGPTANAVEHILLTDPPLSQLGYGPTDMAIRAFSSLHDAGLPWWASIIGLTLMVRTAILPLVIMSQRNSAKLANAGPDLEKFKEEVTLNPPRTEEERQRNARRMMEIYAKHDVSFKGVLVPLFVQLPLFITFFLGLRRLATTYPSMKEGGMLWFTDLSAPDPTYVLPVIAAATFLITIELGGEVSNPQMDTRRMKNILRGVGVLMVPMTMSFESGVLLYWVATNSFSVVQIATLKQPAVKQFLGIPIVVPRPVLPNAPKALSFFEQLDRMSKATESNHSSSSSSSPSSPAAVTATTESKIQEQFVSEMKEARSRRSRRRN